MTSEEKSQRPEPTFLAAAGDTDTVEDLKAGRTIGDTTYKVHIDGYNLLPYLTGEVDKSPRLRYRPAARRPQIIDTGMSQIGFRCITRI